MKLTVIGELACLEGKRVIQKEVRVYTINTDIEEYYGDFIEVEAQVFHPTKQIIEKLIGKTFQGEEYDTYVEINLNQLENGV